MMTMLEPPYDAVHGSELGLERLTWPSTCLNRSTLIISTVSLFSAPPCDTMMCTEVESGFELTIMLFK